MAGPTQVALVTAYNGQGQLLVGKRRDNEQYTLPCGHIEDKEEPEQAARRELFEETGLRAQSLSFMKHYISSENVELWCFSAFVSGEPHNNYDPDGEVPEWEFIDVKEGLPPSVYNHLHGPKGSDNLVMQLFDLKKAEDDERRDDLAAMKPPKVYHSDDWGTARISIPSKNHPDRPKYDQNYMKALHGHYGEVRRVTVGTEELDHVNEVHNKPRFDLYRKMVRDGDRLPPIVLKKQPNKRYLVLDGNHKVHASRAEGGGMLDAVVVGESPSMTKAEELAKAEDEVHRMLAHPDPNERTMALKFGGVQPAHVLAAALDPIPAVHQAAIGHHHFGPTQAHELLESSVGTDGEYPLVQQAHFLAQHDRVSPAHLTSFLRGARAHSPGTFDLATKLMAKHPAATEEMLRDAFKDPSTSHDVRLDILGHANAPSDVLDHAIQLGCLVPAPTSGELARKAVEHMNAPNDTLAKVVYLAADKGDPHANEIAEHALSNGKVSQEVQRDLLMRAMTRPQSTAPRLLEALLRGPSAAHMDPADYDKMLQYAHQAGSATMVKSLSEHPAFGARHMVMLLDKFEVPVEEELEKFDRSFLSSPQVIAQFGFKPFEHPAFRAAAFLSDTVRKNLVNPEVLRAALYQANGDFERAALMAYGIDCTEPNLKALRAVMLVGDFKKGEPTPATAKEISAARPEGQDVAEAVQRAFSDKFAFEIQLGGKHSAGSMICYDNKTKGTWLLKSGTGGAGGAAGAKQDPSNPNAREAAFYHITREWGISEAFPRAELLIVDGHLFAALQWLGGGYKTLDKREKDEPGTARRVLHDYLHDGKLHQWAVADYILGQPDRHGQNVMVDKHGDVKLIDEGSAFAGSQFDPGLDKNSFVPYYLRAWHVDPSFNQLSPEEKMRYMPRVSESVSKALRSWVDSLLPDALGQLCQRYEIDPKPTLDRLARVKSAVASNQVDLAINHLWVTT